MLVHHGAISKILPRNVVRTWGSDAAGNQTGSMDGNGNTWVSYFDVDNREVLAVAPGLPRAFTATVYDGDSEVVATYDGNSDSTFSVYDPDGEQTVSVAGSGLSAAKSVCYR
jgi:hypothetical protein